MKTVLDSVLLQTVLRGMKRKDLGSVSSRPHLCHPQNKGVKSEEQMFPSGLSELYCRWWYITSQTYSSTFHGDLTVPLSFDLVQCSLCTTTAGFSRL